MKDCLHERTLLCVREFHDAFGHSIDIPLDSKGLEELHLRMKLLSEEFREVVEAAAETHNAIYQKRGPSTQARARAHLLKELCDLQYVLDGFFVAFGLSKLPAFNRVHASNMSKLGEDGKPIVREDGKVLKGPNYFEPDLSDLVEDQ